MCNFSNQYFRIFFKLAVLRFLKLTFSVILNCIEHVHDFLKLPVVSAVIFQLSPSYGLRFRGIEGRRGAGLFANLLAKNQLFEGPTEKNPNFILRKL